MSAFSSPAPGRSMAPVRSVGVNAWLITCAAERTSTRARHGRARWSLSASLRRKPAMTWPLRALA